MLEFSVLESPPRSQSSRRGVITVDRVHDYLILGAGPAGLQLGYFMKQAGRDFAIVDRAAVPGAFFIDLPRHRYLLSINKVFTGQEDVELNLRWDWNSLICDNPDLSLPDYTGEYFPDPDHLVRYMADFADYYDLPITYKTEITRVSKTEDGFQLTDDKQDTWKCRCLIIASGVPHEYIPDIPGIDLCETYGSHSLDPDDYQDQRVLIVGKGNSGFETADNLIGTASVIHLVSPSPVHLAWKTHYVGAVRAINNNFLDTYQLKSQNAVIDGAIEWVKKEDDNYQVKIAYSHAMGQTTTRSYDRVIVCTGFRFDNSIFDEDCRPDLTENKRFPRQTTAWESTNVPGMFFAGTIMQACDYKKTQSAFIHGFRNNIRSLSWILAQRYQGEPWPHHTAADTPEAVVERIVDRLSRASGIFQQPGFLSEVVVVDEKAGELRH
ncbi:MAG: NAD(P)-binding domain-containing protein, partial [Anaerolineales bacterium]